MNRHEWKILPFLEAFADKTSLGNKIQQTLFNSSGSIPIVDQGAEYIAGYSDDGSLAWSDELPVVVFGDHTRAIKYVDFPFILGADGVKVLVPREGLSAKFAYYCLSSLVIPSRGYSRHFRFLKEFQVPVPPLAEQERIVKLLDEADELRKLRAQADRRSADLIPALFHEMFGDPVANLMGWPLHKLPEACAGKEGIKAGPFGSSLKKDCYTAEGPRVYGQEQVIAGDFTIGDYHISEEKFNEMAAYAVAADDVLISLVGTIGKVAIVPDAIERGIINPRLLRVRPRREMMHPVYLSHVLTAPSIVTFFGGVATGITMGVLNAGMLKRLSIPVPPLPLQKQFAQRVSEIRALQAAQAASRKQTEHLFQSMLHRAFDQAL